MMGTYVSIFVQAPKKQALKAISLAMNRMQQIVSKFDPNNIKSPIYDFNKNNEPIKDQEIIDVIKLALYVSEESNGAFDITVYKLSELWGFADKKYRVPQENEINDVLKDINYQQVILKDGMIIKNNKDIEIDLGGIAKGYAVSQAVKVLKDQGISSAIVDAGGDIYALGKRRGRPWKVGIRDPSKDGNFGFLEVEDLAVMGSGNYERFFTEGNKKYHHIFNPKDGHPGETLKGVTVIYPDPTLADAWATAIFVMGDQAGLKKAEEIKNLEAIFFTSNNNILSTSTLMNSSKVIPNN